MYLTQGGQALTAGRSAGCARAQSLDFNQLSATVSMAGSTVSPYTHHAPIVGRRGFLRGVVVA